MLLAKSSFSNDRGFSLVETLVATTIMSVALASLAQLFLISTKANQSARHHDQRRRCSRSRRWSSCAA